MIDYLPILFLFVHISDVIYMRYIYHCKKLEVDLTPKNVISVAVCIHAGPGSGRLLLPGFRPLSSDKQTMNWVANEIHFVIACLCQRGGTLAIFMCSWMDSENYSCTIG